MPKHEEYESLCALALIGELSAQEQAELLEHMRGCDACCRSSQDFVDVMQHIPIEERASICETKKLEEDARMRQFLSRAQGEGVVFSRDAFQPEPLTISRRKLISIPMFAIGPALAAMLLLGVGLVVLMQHLQQPINNAPVGATPRLSLPVRSNTASIANPNPDLEAKLANAEDALAAAQKKLSDLDSKVDATEKERAAAHEAIREREEALTRLNSKFSDQEQRLAQANSDVKRSEADRDHAVASLVADESRMRDLETELSNAQAAVEQEKELNAAARDVRELMGARNLHIIDVYDSDNHSRADRSFGRVIYTEGKSLIFYAFDLDNARNVKKVSFQAWGEREGEHRDAKKLGTFYVDDAAQRRWVLKVNDSEKLKSIDTVFVTVENHRDVNVPNHQRLLQAYLGSTANHP